jgi:uncharacterized membrane protein YecN with MAPEG domain
MALIVIALLENSGAPAIAIHSLGGGLCLARLAHAQGIKAESMSGAGRVIGAAGTALITVVAAIWAIVMYF